MPKENKNKSLVKSPNLFPVVGIGASAGGLEAFKKLIKAIPENSGMAFVLVQHLDPKHESMLPELLQKVTTIPVLEISDDIKVQPNHIYIIPSNKMMVANDGVLLLSPRTTNKNERNLPVDIFFTSLAEVHQSHSIGVVLSGTASDGTKGLKAIKDHGGITFAQDEESAAFDGMPHSAVMAGVVDFILPPEKIPQKLLEITKIINGNGREVENLTQQEVDVFKQMLSLLRIRKGTDFTYYKQTTIRRRILRRMALNKNEEPDGYLKFLRENKTEQDVLFQDLLIPVTSFFRDPKSFDNLCETVFPLIAKSKTAGEPIRLWIAGCSTGQEVYSVAICLKEYLSSSLSFGPDSYREGRGEVIQIFATDISEPAIAKARLGIYTKSETDGLSPQRLQDFFVKNNGGYQVNKSIRDMCVFAVHNFVKDPPFGKMGFISCRNVLIYMEPYLQKKALTTFHYALNEKGFLLLGKSETISSVPELFASSMKHDKIFSRKDVPGRFMNVASRYNEQNLLKTDASRQIGTVSETYRTVPIAIGIQKTADDIMLSKYTPAGVVVNEAMDIVHFRGKTGNFLEQLPGKPSHNLLKMAKEGLAFELRNILHKAKKEKATVIKENIPVQIKGNLHTISIEALPLPDTIEPHYLVLFHEKYPDSNRDGSGQLAPLKGGSSKHTTKQKNDDKDLRIAQLEKELAQAREDMRSITEDQEAANEELQSANEELLSGSEELQSLNEEMETSKEELQSTNEELTVVNQEMIGLNEQVTDVRDYAEAIVTTVREPLLVLDKKLRVKSANNAYYKTFKVNEQETEGRLIYNLGDNQWNIPELRTLLEEILPRKTNFADFEVTHNFPNIGERVMLLNAREITREKTEEKLILLSIEDITEVRNFALEKEFVQKSAFEEKIEGEKKISEAYRIANANVRNLFLEAPAVICVLRGPQHVIELANDMYLQMVGKRDVVGKPIREALPELEGQGFFELMDNVYTTGERITGNETPAQLDKGNGKLEQVYFNFVYQPAHNSEGEINGILVHAVDVTEQVLARKKIAESEFRYHNMIYTSPSLIAIFKGEDMIIDIANDAVLENWGKQKDIIGKSLYSVFPELIKQGFDKLLLGVYKTGEPFYAYETPVTIIKNGKPQLMHYTFVYQAQRNAGGEIEGVAVIANEVTPQALLNKKLKESEAFNRTVLESSPDCVKMLDEEGRLQFMNTNGVCLLEIDDFKSVENTYWWDMWEPHNRQIIKDAVASAKKGEKIQLQLFGPTAKGTPKWWDIIVLPVQHDGADKNLHRILSVSRDITEQKQSELKEKELLARFQTLVVQAPVAICVLRGEEYVIETLNEGMCEFWGRTLEQALNKPAFDVLPELRDQGIKELLDNVYHTGERYVVQELPVSLMRKGKLESVFVKFVYEPLREADGSITGVMALAHEITEQVLARKKIEESEEQYRQLTDSLPPLVWQTDAQGNQTYASKRWKKFTGIDPENAGSFEKMVHPDDIEGIIKAWSSSLTTGTTYRHEVRLKSKAGKYHWFQVHGEPLYNNEKEIEKWIGAFTDINEHKEAEERIKESEAKFRSLIEEAPVATCLFTGREMIIEVANDKILAYWGKGKDIIGQPLANGVPELRGQHFFQILDDVFTTGKVHEGKNEVAQLRVNGVLGTYYFDYTYKPIRNAAGEVYGIMNMAIDVTEQVLARKKIEESEAHFRLLADMMPAKITNTNARGDVIYFNQQWLNYSGYSFEELKEFGYHKMFHPDELEEYQKRFQQASASETVLEMEMRFLNKNGEYKWHLNLASPVLDENGNIKMWVGVTTEIQQQKEQREELEVAITERTQQLIHANEELIQKNQEIALSKYNKRFLTEFSDKFSAYKLHNEFFNSLVQFIADTTHLDYVFVAKVDHSNECDYSVQTIALNAFGKPADNINYPLPDGPCEQVVQGTLYSYPEQCRSIFPLNKTIAQFNVEGYIGYPLYDEQGTAVGLIAVMHKKKIEDPETVSSILKIVAKRAEIELERIKNEDQLVQHNITLEDKNEELLKMNKELQAFTYVSSHDLQEPLRKIQNFISHLLEKDKQTLSEKGTDYFRRIQESAKRMQTLIQDLLAFSHINKTDRIFENASLYIIIEQVKADLAETIQEKNATIQTGEMCDVKIIPFLIHQLFYNLISNSIKFSIPGKASYIIINSKIDEGINLNNERPAQLADRLSPKKRYCHISLTDNGIGFDPQYKDRIFGLFQRLHGKEEYPGTGVGLAIVKKIVDNHNGIITASGGINEGARFDIYIPA